jgi:hypothetical protein
LNEQEKIGFSTQRGEAATKDMKREHETKILFFQQVY